MSKKITILLCISLFLNVFLIGILTGYILNKPSGPHFPFPHKDDAVFLAKLPKEKQAVYREIVKKVNETGEISFREMRQRKKPIIDVLTAPEFDSDAYLAREKEFHDYFNKIRLRSLHATIEFAQQLTQEERRALADHLRGRGPMGHSIMPRPPHRGGPPPWEKQSP